MFKNYTVQTFVAWWIGASIGFIVAQLTVGEGGWDSLCTAVAVYTGVLYTVYGLNTARGLLLLNQVKARLAPADAEV